MCIRDRYDTTSIPKGLIPNNDADLQDVLLVRAQIHLDHSKDLLIRVPYKKISLTFPGAGILKIVWSERIHSQKKKSSLGHYPGFLLVPVLYIPGTYVSIRLNQAQSWTAHRDKSTK